MISRSPDRGRFQTQARRQRLQEQGQDPDQDEATVALEAFERDWMQRKLDSEQDPDWQRSNLEHDLRTTDWILQKVRASDDYARDLYAALCNNDFQENSVWPVLKDETWGCSWRYAGGIIADMRESGDYIDWYCSGNEGRVTDEVRQDLLRLGWCVVESMDQSA